MPGQCLRRLRKHSAVDKVRDERMAQRVEVCHAPRVVFHGHPRRRQVRRDHLRARVPVRHREGPRIGQPIPQVRAHRFRSLPPERLHVFAPVLGVPRLHRHGRRYGVQGEAIARERPQFVPPQPRVQGQTVEHRAIRARHPLDRLPVVRRRDQLPTLLRRQRAPPLAPVRCRVQLLQVRHGRFMRPPFGHHPPAELLEGGQVVVARLDAQARFGFGLGAAFAGKEHLDTRRGDFAPSGESAPVQNRPRPRRRRVNVHGRVALRPQRRLEIGQVRRQRLRRRHAPRVQKTDLLDLPALRLRQPFKPGRQLAVRRLAARVAIYQALQPLPELLRYPLVREGRYPPLAGPGRPRRALDTRGRRHTTAPIPASARPGPCTSAEIPA